MERRRRATCSVERTNYRLPVHPCGPLCLPCRLDGGVVFGSQVEFYCPRHSSAARVFDPFVGLTKAALYRRIGRVQPLHLWACGAAGSALPWHGRGHRFDPDQVHQITQQLSGTPLQRLAANWQQISNCRAAKPCQSSPSPLWSATLRLSFGNFSSSVDHCRGRRQPVHRRVQFVVNGVHGGAYSLRQLLHVDVCGGGDARVPHHPLDILDRALLLG
jgi:hypothetical protein